jgi:hypothetical protein
MTRSVLRLAVCSAAVALCTACAEDVPTLDEVRAATAKYQDPEVALAEGYIRDPMDVCETSYYLGSLTDEGTMGVHFFRPDLLGVTIGEGELDKRTRHDVQTAYTDFSQPALLVYEPQPDSVLELVAVANMVSARAWEEAGHREPPTFGDVPYDYHPDTGGSGFAAYYDLHMWLFRENPSGMFAAYNPAVSCEHHAFNLPSIVPPDSLHSAPHH